jgi:hypothetical protein
VLDEVPATPNDRRVAMIVTDAETISISTGGPSRRANP